MHLILLKVHMGLQKLLGKPISVGEDSSMDQLTFSVWKPMNTEELPENDKKLRKAADLLHECYNPIVDSRSGTDIIDDHIFCRE